VLLFSAKITGYRTQMELCLDGPHLFGMNINLVSRSSLNVHQGRRRRQKIGQRRRRRDLQNSGALLPALASPTSHRQQPRMVRRVDHWTAKTTTRSHPLRPYLTLSTVVAMAAGTVMVPGKFQRLRYRRRVDRICILGPLLLASRHRLHRRAFFHRQPR
jgi:hypothetical protein